MTFELTEDHEELRALVRGYAEAEIAPKVAAWDSTNSSGAHYFPVEVVRGLGELGLFGLTVPEEYGGTFRTESGGHGSGGSDFTSLCVAIEELGRIDQSIGITLSAGVGLGINPILAFGTDEQKQTWLPDLVAGRALAAFGLTEPEAGSDASATRTRARLDRDQWVLDGAKAFITNSGTEITSVITVTARTDSGSDPRRKARSGDRSGRAVDPSTSPAEISALLVPAGTPGLTVDPPYDKLGWRTSDTHGLTFHGARVPAGNLLGKRGRGYAQFLAMLDDGRIAIAALALGLARACLEACTSYAAERRSFGAPIGSRQGVAFAISDLAVSVEAARLLTYRAAWLKDRSSSGAGAARAEVKQAASIAKLYSSEAAVAAARTATQVFGGYGFMEEYPVARYYRDAKILEIGEGTSEIQRILIARGLGLPVS
ncbi:MAG: acyl-CoA dehydrogenase family protein [Nocardioides sp.]